MCGRNVEKKNTRQENRGLRENGLSCSLAGFPVVVRADWCGPTEPRRMPPCLACRISKVRCEVGDTEVACKRCTRLGQLCKLEEQTESSKVLSHPLSPSPTMPLVLYFVWTPPPSSPPLSPADFARQSQPVKPNTRPPAHPLTNNLLASDLNT